MAREYFKELNYAMGDEDSSVEVGVLPLDSSIVVSIAGSGGRILPLLLKAPQKIICCDISIVQLYLTELRISAVKQLSFEEYSGFLGYPPYTMSNTARKRCFSSLKLSDEAKRYLSVLFEKNAWSEIIYLGKFEKMLQTISSMNKVIIGSKRMELFEFDNLADQIIYINESFPYFRWMISLFTLGNSNALNALLYKGKFPKKNVDGSHYNNYKMIFDRLFNNILCKDSFFLQMVFLGKLKFEAGNLLEAQKDAFSIIKNNIYSTKIELYNSSILDIKKNSVDFISLSDVPSFLPQPLDFSFLQILKPTLSEMGKIIYRGHLRIPNPDVNGFQDITSDFTSLINKETSQLWKIKCVKNITKTNNYVHT